MDSIFETQRATHEEIERYEQALADVLMQNPTAVSILQLCRATLEADNQQRNITRRDRKAADILERIGELQHNLVLMYEDIPGLRPTELQALTAPAKGEGDELAEFYSRFEKIKDFHRKNTNINARQLINEIEDMVNSDGLEKIEVEGEEEPMIVDRELTWARHELTSALDNVFSGEEAYGRHLDLYQPHTMYLNLKGSSRLSYVAYLDMLRHGRVERTLDLREKGHPDYLQ